MSRLTLSFKGGDKYKRILENMAGRLGTGGAVSVGFFEKERYAGVHPIRGTKRFNGPVAQVAFWNEFGTSTSPPRPFFRGMIAAESPTWGEKLGKVAKATGYDTQQTLGRMGEGIKDQLVTSIVQFSDPENAPRTIAIKGFNKPLVDDGTMQRAVGSEVKT